MKTLINFKTLSVEVTFDYYPPEPPVRWYDDGDGYPGSDAKIEIDSILHKEENITSFFEETGLIYKLEEAILKEINLNNE